MNICKAMKVIVLGLAIAVQVHAANFELFYEGNQVGINCQMNHEDVIQLDYAIGLPYGEASPKSVFLKDAMPGTKVLLNGDEIAEAMPELTANGYQSMYIPANEYEMTLKRPDGLSLSFLFLRNGASPCVLNWEEIVNAFGK